MEDLYRQPRDAAVVESQIRPADYLPIRAGVFLERRAARAHRSVGARACGCADEPQRAARHGGAPIQTVGTAVADRRDRRDAPLGLSRFRALEFLDALESHARLFCGDLLRRTAIALHP